MMPYDSKNLDESEQRDWDRWRGSTDSRLSSIDETLKIQIQTLTELLKKLDETVISNKTLIEQLHGHITNIEDWKVKIETKIEDHEDTIEEVSSRTEALKSKVLYFAGGVTILLPIMTFLGGLLIHHVSTDKVMDLNQLNPPSYSQPIAPQKGQ